MRKTARVIWIYSKDIRVIDAKLSVYKKYENEIKGNRSFFLLHHAFEEHDEIFKLSGVLKFESLREILSSFATDIDISSKSLRAILHNAAEKTWNKETIRKACQETKLKCGTCESESYVCDYYYEVKEFKQSLLKDSLEGLVTLFGSNICDGLVDYLQKETKRKLDISSAVRSVMRDVVNPIFSKYLLGLGDIFLAAFQFLAKWFISKDVNSIEWRNEVADEIHTEVRGKLKDIIEKVFDEIQKIPTQTMRDLQMALRQIDIYKKRIGLPDLEARKYTIV